MPEKPSVPVNRTEHVLVAMVVAIVAMSVIAIAGTMIGAAMGAEMSSGLWPALMLLGYLGFPLAFLLIVAFIVVSARRRRSRPSGDGGH